MADAPRDSLPTTWTYYKAHLPRTQISILVFCIIVYYVARPNLIMLVTCFVALQVMAYFGVWWGLRTAKRMTAKEDKLPLQGP